MEDDSMLLKRLDMLELKLDVILKELALSRGTEKCLVSGMDVLLEEAKRYTDMNRIANGMKQKKCTVVNMLTKVNGGGGGVIPYICDDSLF